MTAILMRRKTVDDLLTQQTAVFSHAGLWLSRGLKTLDDDQPGLKQEHIQQAVKIPVPEVYQKAFARWQTIVTSADTMAYWCGKLENRLFIGTGGASVLETAITLSRTYGVPVIPGSAVKGVTHAYAKKAGVKDLDLLFGSGGVDPDSDAAGAVIFHDAWWVPNSAKTPLAAEVVTVHHQAYYGNGDKTEVTAATDFDSPIPAPQIAAQGSFLFAVECGDKAWADCACNLLAQALENWGIGGKTAAGYGRFGEDEKCRKDQEAIADQECKAAQQRQAEAAEQARLAAMSPLEREMEEAAKAEPGSPKYLAVLKALEQKKWEGDTARQVAELVKQWMQTGKIWRDKSEKKKPEKDEPYQRTLRVKKFLG